ncbi:MAG: nicotinate-nucleotide adenylyltransferase [Proteobacteria bacterium]|nr:nicotinate-nucleotide adenylyltransferase [Pseudomonadota bacterium]
MVKSKRIGLLGGSFNPAHRGHIYISETAIERLALDEVWWLVSPQNPLKERAGMAAFAKRVADAKAVVGDRPIIVSEIEQELDTRYTVDTLRVLTNRYPEHRFVWLMGADNLLQLPKWKRWRGLFRLIPIAVFPRPSFSRRSLIGKAARRFARFRIPEFRAKSLASRRPPAWIFLRMKPDPISATGIRNRIATEESEK